VTAYKKLSAKLEAQEHGRAVPERDFVFLFCVAHASQLLPFWKL
jgi:hypothetical protein